MLLPSFRRSARSLTTRSFAISESSKAALRPIERRRFQRWSVRTAVTFRNLSQGGLVGTACVEDLSQGGLLVLTESPVDIGDAVSCELDGLLLMGEVVHYRSFGARQVIGVKLVHNLDTVQLEAALNLFWKHNEFKT